MNATLRTRNRRGSVLLIAMIFAAIIAISLTSSLRNSITAVRLSQRSLLANEAVNLAETGVEQALWSFNQALAGGTAAISAWTDWVAVGGDARRTFSGSAHAYGATGAVKVFVRNYTSTGVPMPVVIAEATITPPHGAGIKKMLEVHLQRRSLFSTGMIGRNGIVFSGTNASVDSWSSDPDHDPSTAPVAYSSTVRRDRATLAALNVNATISVNNAEVWGFVSVGGGSTSSVTLGPNGLVGAFGTSPGTKDPTRMASNFTENLPDVIVPSPAVINTIADISAGQTLPGALDLPSSDGKYHYRIGFISLSGTTTSDVLRIAPGADVVMQITAGAGVTGVSISGSSSIDISSGSSLAVYTASDILVAGNGLVNANAEAKTLQLWGTHSTPGSQRISVTGNGSLCSVIYAPDANVTINGNGHVMGAVVAYTAALTGEAAFHYDEALANWGPNTPFKACKWRERISAADREAVASNFAF